MANKCEEEKNDFEKPLSPVLSKFLRYRKMQKKSRVKLTDRFVENTSSNSKGDDTYGSIADETMTSIQSEDGLFEKLDSANKLRENELQIENEPAHDFQFKKPLSPVVCTKEPKEMKHMDIIQCGGFKTAGGQSINITDDFIKKSSKLFDDILYLGPSQNSRSRKYAFLHKRKSDFNNSYINKDFPSVRKKSFEAPIQSVKDVDSARIRIIDNNKEIDVLNSQETDLLFSNFTILENNVAKRETFENIGDFKGFPASQIENSRKIAEEYKTAISKYHEELLSRHHKVSIKLSRTKTATATPLKDIGNNSLNKTSNAGFPIGPGKKSRINESSLNTAKNKFGEEFDFNSIDLNHSIQPLIKPEIPFLNTQVLNELFSDFPNEENKCKKATEDISTENTTHEPFKSFLDESIEKSKNKVEIFSSLFETHCDHEKTLVSTFNARTQLQNEPVKTVVVQSGEFTTASGNRLTVRKAALNRAQRMYKETDDIKLDHLYTEKNEPGVGFRTAAGKSVSLSENAINRAKQRFQSINNELSINSNETLLANAEKKFSVQKRRNDSFKPVVCETGGFTFASGNKPSVSKASLDRAQRIFNETDDIKSDHLYTKFPANNKHDETIEPTVGFKTTSENSDNSSADIMNRAKQLQTINSDSSSNNSFNSSTTLIQESISFGNNSNVSTKSISNYSSIRKKKRLGRFTCTPIPISKHQIEQAVKLFKDENLAIMSPIRTKAPSIYNSTPLKGAQILHIESDLTPIKNIDNTVVLNPKFERIEDLDDRFTIQECTKGNIDSWNKLLENEKRNLEMKIKILTEKQECLRVQKHLTENNPLDRRRKHSGILFNKKQSSERVSLQQFLELDSSCTKKIGITPQNAELLHFNYAHQNVSKIHTLDGACVIPNINNSVGLSEIESAFKVIDGVDPKLIPNGWLRNHFRWIVWKLASYENFAVNMKDSLTLENVIQQLKYRYDREIDRAERSTLRKIFETDDVPQKRMVLCVANIFNSQSGQFELELTDGWYSIRTVIDEPLCKQVITKKIQIGTKLMIYGAELLNCGGCHPLEATELVRLKINCNSTRRTRWYVKLGYQKCLKPFPLKLYSLFPNGGLIGCIKIFVARIYPVKYLEKQNKHTVWRNRKAEAIRAQEWENKKHQDMEKLRETITRDYETSMRSTRQNRSANISNDEIIHINCPETLFNLYQNSKDPETLQAMLTGSQRKSILDYQQHLSFIQHQEISRKMEDSLGELKISKRDVSSVFQFLVLDVLHPNEKAHVFQIWRPSDDHLQTIKESSVFYVHNVLPKKNGDLCTMKRSTFEFVSKEAPEFTKYKRTLLTISNVTELVNKPVFNQFDTVGVVISMTITDCTQCLWLSDFSQKLLYVKMFEGPKTCLLLDKLKIGQIVAASNLIFGTSKLEFAEAIANHLSVISCYPQQRHLQEGINSLNEQLPKDLEVFLQQCNQKILYYVEKVDITKNHKSMSTRSLVQSHSDIFDDSSDVLYSMIDVDKFD